MSGVEFHRPDPEQGKPHAMTSRIDVTELSGGSDLVLPTRVAEDRGRIPVESDTFGDDALELFKDPEATGEIAEVPAAQQGDAHYPVKETPAANDDPTTIKGRVMQALGALREASRRWDESWWGDQDTAINKSEPAAVRPKPVEPKPDRETGRVYHSEHARSATKTRSQESVHKSRLLSQGEGHDGQIAKAPYERSITHISDVVHEGVRTRAAYEVGSEQGSEPSRPIPKPLEVFTASSEDLRRTLVPSVGPLAVYAEGTTFVVDVSNGRFSDDLVRWAVSKGLAVEDHAAGISSDLTSRLPTEDLVYAHAVAMPSENAVQSRLLRTALGDIARVLERPDNEGRLLPVSAADLAEAVDYLSGWRRGLGLPSELQDRLDENLPDSLTDPSNPVIQGLRAHFQTLRGSGRDPGVQRYNFTSDVQLPRLRREYIPQENANRYDLTVFLDAVARRYLEGTSGDVGAVAVVGAENSADPAAYIRECERRGISVVSAYDIRGDNVEALAPQLRSSSRGYTFVCKIGNASVARIISHEVIGTEPASSRQNVSETLQVGNTSSRDRGSSKGTNPDSVAITPGTTASAGRQRSANYSAAETISVDDRPFVEPGALQRQQPGEGMLIGPDNRIVGRFSSSGAYRGEVIPRPEPKASGSLRSEYDKVQQQIQDEERGNTKEIDPPEAADPKSKPQPRFTGGAAQTEAVLRFGDYKRITGRSDEQGFRVWQIQKKYPEILDRPKRRRR